MCAKFQEISWNHCPVPVVPRGSSKALSTGAHSGVWSRAEGTLGETKEPQADTTKNKQITNSGLETNFFRNSFFPQRFATDAQHCHFTQEGPDDITSPQRAAQPPKPSDKDHLCCTVPKVRHSRRRWLAHLTL